MYLFKVYSSMVFSVFTESCNHSHTLILEHFLHPKRKPIPMGSHSACPFPVPPDIRPSAFCLSQFAYFGHFI